MGMENNTESAENTKGIDVSSLPMLNIGMVGHIDHGKTTLLSRLTGKWTDTHSEELKRGITIKLGYADAIIRKGSQGYNIKEGEPVLYASFVDAPGHEMLMATMLSGAAIIDAAILVIAANEGIKPQTSEHLVALQAKNIKEIIIVQNKIDLVTKEKALQNYKEIREFVKGTIAENSPIIPVSAQQEININKLLEAIVCIKIPKRDTESKPIFLIARSFDINRPGTDASKLRGGVLGGALRKGKLSIGDEIEIKPGISKTKANVQTYETIKTRITSIRRGESEISEATPGGSLAIETELDPGLTKADSFSGCVAGLADTLPEITSRIKIKFRLFENVIGIQESKHVDAVKVNEMLLLSINTSITIGTVIKAKANEAELVLKIPVVPFKSENIGIARNINTHWRLIGFGEII